ncbi:unnamed protein product [Tuber melanosporum]|uniref:(Perigord truffle) hypothetical protein n=1 Tax=Tuber melanosporum (strain Mel28) TaxID=656061 RepID=D5G8C2_TUBMM|nr:uncharacterized protein GSTUM_00004734001 [Tuber melanosporum]CAZ80765.1 unnamed protein product [Tuber melanosporum]
MSNHAARMSGAWLGGDARVDRVLELVGGTVVGGGEGKRDKH